MVRRLGVGSRRSRHSGFAGTRLTPSEYLRVSILEQYYRHQSLELHEPVSSQLASESCLPHSNGASQFLATERIHSIWSSIIPLPACCVFTLSLLQRRWHTKGWNMVPVLREPSRDTSRNPGKCYVILAYADLHYRGSKSSNFSWPLAAYAPHGNGAT